MREDRIVFNVCRKYGLRVKRIRYNHFESRHAWKDRFYILINFDGAEFRYYRISGIPDDRIKDKLIEEIASSLRRYHSLVEIYPDENEVEFYLM
ncbi:MAG: hypothetical protein DRP01_00515 [Archaeoglobales archaeon]|nr:MAG: hypothetical protein DRP01_00515 [Archaeoglobales archaeon]